MPIITKSDLDRIVGPVTKSADFSQSVRLAEASRTKKYDVFLSHSAMDKQTILQVNDLLEKTFGLDVYVDWIENPDLKRDSVTPATAAELRSVMDRCKTLLYAVSTNAASSTWMPWELGYSDAKHGLVAVLPIAEQNALIAAYQNQEFVGLYPYVDMANIGYTGTRALWINDPGDSTHYTELKKWMSGGLLTKHV